MTTEEAGRLGGQARANKLSGTKRHDIAVNASRKRWAMLSAKDLGTNDSDKTMLTAKHHEVNKYNSNWCDTHNRSLYRCQQLDLEAGK